MAPEIDPKSFGTFEKQGSEVLEKEVIKFWVTLFVFKATTRVGGHGERIAQCKEAVLVTRKALPMQVDGGIVHLVL